MQIKKEVQQFIIASEGLYRLFSQGEPLSCHEAEILNCCMDELIKRRSPFRPPSRLSTRLTHAPSLPPPILARGLHRVND